MGGYINPLPVAITGYHSIQFIQLMVTEAGRPKVEGLHLVTAFSLVGTVFQSPKVMQDITWQERPLQETEQISFSNRPSCEVGKPLAHQCMHGLVHSQDRIVTQLPLKSHPLNQHFNTSQIRIQLLSFDGSTQATAAGLP
jgi:hypothetical protein